MSGIVEREGIEIRRPGRDDHDETRSVPQESDGERQKYVVVADLVVAKSGGIVSVGGLLELDGGADATRSNRALVATKSRPSIDGCRGSRSKHVVQQTTNSIHGGGGD